MRIPIRILAAFASVLALGTCSSEGREFFPSTVEIAGSAVACNGIYDIGAILSGEENHPTGVSGNGAKYDPATEKIRIVAYASSGNLAVVIEVQGDGDYVEAAPAVNNANFCDYTVTVTCGVFSGTSGGLPEFLSPTVIAQTTPQCGGDTSTLALTATEFEVFRPDAVDVFDLDGVLTLTNLDVGGESITVTLTDVLGFEDPL